MELPSKQEHAEQCEKDNGLSRDKDRLNAYLHNVVELNSRTVVYCSLNCFCFLVKINFLRSSFSINVYSPFNPSSVPSNQSF